MLDWSGLEDRDHIVQLPFQEKAMAKKQADARKALEAVGGTPSEGYYANNTATAAPPPGSLSGGCSLTDPTGTGGCVTPRLNYAYKQARAAGFTRYTKCFRNASSGEHGKGRACDFAANADGFVDAAASGANKEYGNRWAAYFIKNADRLGVLYVIWYRQIWMPGNGWSSYSGGGSPSGDHTNHVHLSVT